MGGQAAGKIICGIDDSEGARNALSTACSLADRLEYALVLLHVAAPALPSLGLGPILHFYPGELERRAAEHAGEHLLEITAEGLDLPAFVERRVEVGHAPMVIPAVAEAEEAELIVVGTRGRGALSTSLFGSVSSATVRNAPCPVLVVPSGAGLRPGPIVCALDESSAAHGALRLARRLSDRLAADLVLAHVVTSPWVPGASAVPWGHAELDEQGRSRAEALLEAAFELGEDPGIEGRLVAGSEAEAIVDLAEDEGACLIVIGARRSGTIRSAVAGSVFTALTATSSTPVLVVPDGARLPLRA